MNAVGSADRGSRGGAFRPLVAAALTGAIGFACGCAQLAPSVPVRIEISHLLGSAPLQLGEESAHGRAVTRLAYYFGGVRLRGRDGGWVHTAGDDIVLVDAQKPDSTRFEALRAPPRAYDSIEFRIGVPASLADGHARTGALDPANGMFWTWKAGYVFFALEGRAPTSAAADHAITWHVGGDPALVRTVVLPLNGFDVHAKSAPEIHLEASLDELLAAVDLSRDHTVMEPAASGPIADALAAMFRVGHVHLDEAVPGGT